MTNIVVNRETNQQFCSSLTHARHAYLDTSTRRKTIGRENHKMMLDHYQQTKNLLVSYSDKPPGFF
jgi:hypothetical protein